MAKTLMVLGNGFDLACGLKSGFRDFLDSDYYSSTLDEMKAFFGVSKDQWKKNYKLY